MKRFLSITMLLGLLSLGLNAVAQSAGQPGSASQSSAAQGAQQQQTDTQSARSFEGKISKVGNKLVLRDAATHQSYQLDDQEKAKQYEGKDVKVTATMDPYTNTLHVVDITSSAK